MRLKRVISIILAMVMMFSLSIDAFAYVLNMTSGRDATIQVVTDTDQFFNVIFQEEEWTPNAEQVYVMHMGLSYDMWRHSGDISTAKGDQRWNTSFGKLTDYQMHELMQGTYGDAVVYQNQVLPDGVRNYLNNGGSWEDIRVTFQCANSDGIFLNHEEIFQNGAVDAWLKWGSEIQLAFKPYFKGSADVITNLTSTKITKAEYPYSNTMFSMFKKGGGHRGATMVHDPEHGEPKDKYTSQGFDSLYFTDIINSKGDLAPNKALKNIELSCSGCGCSSHPTVIDTNTVRIGNGSTFNSGGAIGISFHFPVRVTFEINPKPAGNVMSVSELSIVSMSDNGSPDNLTTHASMQAYANRADLIRFLGGEDGYKALVASALAELYGRELTESELDSATEDGIFTSNFIYSIISNSDADKINELIRKSKESAEILPDGAPSSTEVTVEETKQLYDHMIGSANKNAAKALAFGANRLNRENTTDVLDLINDGECTEYSSRETIGGTVGKVTDMYYLGYSIKGFTDRCYAAASRKPLVEDIAHAVNYGISDKLDSVDDLDKIIASVKKDYALAAALEGIKKIIVDEDIKVYDSSASLSIKLALIKSLAYAIDYGRSGYSEITGEVETYKKITKHGAIKLHAMGNSESYSNRAKKISICHEEEIKSLYTEGLYLYQEAVSGIIASRLEEGKLNNGTPNQLIRMYLGKAINVMIENAVDAEYLGEFSNTVITLLDLIETRNADEFLSLIESTLGAETAVKVRDSGYGRVVIGNETVNKMTDEEVVAVKSSAIGRYMIQNENGEFSSSMSIMTTGNFSGMMKKIEEGTAKTVILLPTTTRVSDKEIIEDSFRKYAYARSERLYNLLKNKTVFNKVVLNNGLENNLITGNHDDLYILDYGKLITEMNDDKFRSSTFYGMGYDWGILSKSSFARVFREVDGSKLKTLDDFNILGKVNGEVIKIIDDSALMEVNNVKKADGTWGGIYAWDYPAYTFDNTEDMQKFLDDVIWRCGSTAMTVRDVKPEDRTLGEASNIYDGGVAYTDVIVDHGCKIQVNGYAIDNSGKVRDLSRTGQGIVFPMTMPESATRYSITMPFKDLDYSGFTNPLLTQNTVGAFNMVAAIPESMSDAEFTTRAKALIEDAVANGTAVEGAILKGNGIEVHVGKSAVENCMVYPTEAQLENNATIRLALFYAEIEKPQIVKVYELVNGTTVQHVNTEVSNAVIVDNTVEILDENVGGTEYKVGEAYVSTDLYNVTNTTPWSEIDAKTSVFGTEVIYSEGKLSVDTGVQQRIYVRMVGDLPIALPVTGDFNITQQTIGKKFDTSALGLYTSDKLSSFASAQHSKRTRYGTTYCTIDNKSDDSYSLNYAMNTNGDGKIFSSISPIESSDLTGNKYWNRRRTNNTTLYPIYRFVAWRGYDKPVAASYANNSTVLNDVYAKFGIGSAKERSASELNTSYTKSSEFKWTIGSGSDTSVSFDCSFGKSHAGTVGMSTSGASVTKNIAVNVYEGWKGAQSPTNSSAASTTMGGVGLTSAHKGTVNGDVIAYYPYVMMKYDDINGNTNSVNVLSKYKSIITPINTVEFGVKKGSNSSLGITSSMWSTHKRAVNTKGANNVLAGGTTYNLGNNGAQLPTMGITTYQWYVPNDASSAVVSGANNTQTKAEQAHNEAVSSLKTAMTGNKLLQHLKAGSNNFVVAPGMSTPWLGSGLNLTNNSNAETKKYWFGGMVNPKTKIISDNGTTREYYRISSDTSGNVILVKGSHTDHTFDITKDNNYILNNMNAEWKEINAKTGLVSAYLGSIIRRAGADTSYGATNGWWYNEAFPGLCVVKQTTTFTVGMDTGSSASLQNVIDLRLVAGGTNSKADIYKNFNDSWFAVEGKNVNFTFRGTSLTVNTGELNLRSKTFYIPNATVYDND